MIRQLALLLFLGGILSFSSCREQPKTAEQSLIDEMQDKGADIKVKEDASGKKIKMETEDEKVKIKTDNEGNTKIKKKDKP